jgi:SAM-dependent methyltransferase
MPDGEWESEAENWVLWARTPGHDAYWYYRDGFFEAVVPPPIGRTLEIGCGEGRVARDLIKRGHDVVALDDASSLVVHARRSDPASNYLRAGGAALPFHDGSFDLVVAYNSLQVVDDMPATVREAARVLQVGGRFCVCLVHPAFDLGQFSGDDYDAPFSIRNAYFETVRVEDTVSRDGLSMTFRGWTHPLESYARALEDAGFLIETVREPRPTGATANFARWQRLPLFMFLRAVIRR